MPRTLKDIEMPESVRKELMSEFELWMEDWAEWTQTQMKSSPGEKWHDLTLVNNAIVDWLRHFSNQPDPGLKNLKCHGGKISLFDIPCCECKRRDG